MDKLIEAAERLKAEFAEMDDYGTFVKKIVCADQSWPYVQIGTGAWLMLKARISGVIEALAAVRAHDAGTDEELRKAIHILRTTPITPEHGFECGTELGVAFSTGFGHAIKILEKASASHAAESTAQLDAEDPADPVEDVVEQMADRFTVMLHRNRENLGV